jgi:catechol 2,3-dioxygenase-like lactoylglutathione lyase family enzyme
MATVSVRYIVHDVDAAIAFYCDDLDFTEVMHPAPAFAMLSRGDLRLVLSAPGGGAGGGQAMPDGAVPEPGGWNRFSIEVADLAATVSELRRKGVQFRNEIVTGVGGKQILAVDPSGNLVELFEPVLPEAQLSEPSLARALARSWPPRELSHRHGCSSPRCGQHATTPHRSIHMCLLIADIKDACIGA